MSRTEQLIKKVMPVGSDYTVDPSNPRYIYLTVRPRSKAWTGAEQAMLIETLRREF